MRRGVGARGFFTESCTKTSDPAPRMDCPHHGETGYGGVSGDAPPGVPPGAPTPGTVAFSAGAAAEPFTRLAPPQMDHNRNAIQGNGLEEALRIAAEDVWSKK